MTAGKPLVQIATKNRGKLAEFERILGAEFEVAGLDVFDIELPEEGTDSYRANAEEKASFVARHTGRITLGDDSGTEVLALEGRPGIISARYAGPPISDQRNIEKLLGELDKLNTDDRSAAFVCWLSVASSAGVITSVEGTCHGAIGSAPRGSNGFGYDPVFVFDNGRTMAELTDEEKDLVSHRGNAIRAILPALRAAVVASDNHD